MGAGAAGGLAEGGGGVAAGGGAVEEEGHGVPAVAAHDGGGRVVAGHEDDVGARVDEIGDDDVRFLDGGYLAVEVAVFSGLVGRLEVEEEEIVLGEPRLQGVDERGAPAGTVRASMPTRRATPRYMG